MRKPLGQNDHGDYLRPHDAWQCGLIDQGEACPPGPLPGGHCPGASACRPVRQADRWICNRSELRGGPCEEGPQLNGHCPHAYHCQPRPTLRTRRGRFVLAIFFLASGLGVIGLSSNYRNNLLAPGPLSTSHAQLTTSAADALRCSHCHAAGNETVGAWLAHSLGDEPLKPAQVDLCLTCHQQTIPPATALHAHHYPEVVSYLAGGGQATRRRDPQVPIACAACHREHQGVGHDLTAVSNATCQACHATQFNSFADGHPELNNWPVARETRIAFDHRTHFAKHYPNEKATFACVDCHRADEHGVEQTTLDYATACARCHDRSIATSLVDGMPLLALPMVDLDALADAGVDVGPWPDQAVGDFDGPAPLLLRLLLAERDSMQPARDAVGPTLDFYDVDFDNPDHLRAAGQVIREIRQLFDELARDGYAVLGQRVERLTGKRMTLEDQRRLAGNLSAETIQRVRQGWLAGQSIPVDAESTAPESRANRAPVAAWRLDDQTATLSYLPLGHADPTLQAWFDLAVAAANGPYRDRVAPLLAEFIEPTSVGLCTSCHRATQGREGAWQIAWTSAASSGSRSFTRFAHGPHLLQPQLADCTSCHAWQDRAESASSSSFAPMSKQDCAACHTSHGAGDACVTCHRYHVDHEPSKLPPQLDPHAG